MCWYQRLFHHIQPKQKLLGRGCCRKGQLILEALSNNHPYFGLQVHLIKNGVKLVATLCKSVQKYEHGKISLQLRKKKLKSCMGVLLRADLTGLCHPTWGVEAAGNQKSFKLLIRYKFPLLRKPQSHFLVDLSKHIVNPVLYFVSIPNGWPCK